MVDIIVWIIIAVLFIASFAGVIFPIIPSPLVLWVGFLLYHFVIDADELTWFFWTAMVVLTGILIVSDVVANSYFVKKYGGSKWGERGAAIAVIIGSFIIPPFGILIIPFVTVFLIEMMQEKTTQEAVHASIGSLIGFLGGAAAKVVIQLAMIAWFFIVIIF
ncbi:MAG TPA: DUF456 domain-containing protein [Lentibacillus sp.]|uniref:DUF456 domain-containing protein n=1 Tax=Lentibacillus sp. TaxID=1925746 RepID=UPI002B4ACD99|nr:DUF456 domain-containing protein [Lentibacillus sp.]HLR60956.1 DUF456 domain-containing protein [Lentibacillus sp.]